MTKPSKFVSRSAWGARPRGATPTTHPIGATRGVTLHWEGPHMGSFPHSECDNKVRAIEAFHRDTRDWADIAYNALVCPHGYVYEGRGVWTKSAANGNTEDNDDWYAVCYLGGEGDPFTSAAKVGFIEAVQWLRSEGGAGSRVNGHRDHKSTECPGDAIYRWLQTANFTADPTPPPPPPLPDATLRVMSWNVKVNRSWTGAILPTLNGTDDTKGILETHKPDVVCLQECYDAPDLVGKVPGYSYRYQGFGYPPKTEGYIEERSNQVILVRDGVELEIAAALEMLENWKGPVVGAWHDPRVHRRVTVRKDGEIWRVIDFHGPFGDDAMAESNAAMVKCLTTFPQDEPIIIVGDFNQTNSTVVTRVGAPGEAVVDGGGIDLAVFKNCRKVLGQNLGNFGSDHPVKLWSFEA